MDCSWRLRGAYLLHSLIFVSLASPAPSPSPASVLLQTEDDQVETFRRYLQIPTAHPSPDYAAAAAFLTAEAAAIGLQSRTLHFAPDKPVVLLTWPGSDPSLPSILLTSHLDTVPADAPRWSHPPFAARRDARGRVFARGAQDDKCLAVQHLEALRALKARDPPFRPLRSVHVSVIPDEEVGGADGMARFAASPEFRDLNVGFALDEGQASPGEEFRVFYADRSPWRLVIKAAGQPGHGSKMYDGSAMEKMVESMEAVARFRDSQFDLVKAAVKPHSEVISLNPVYMKAGTPTPMGFVMNVQPSEAEVGFDVRLPPTADIDQLRKRIEEEWAPASGNMSYQLIQKGPIRDNAGRVLATPANESNPWWLVFEKAIKASGGKLAKPEILSSTTDARFLRQMGIPVLGFSPMSNTPILLHEHDEFLTDAVFLNGIRVYEHLIKELSSFPGM